MIQCIELLTLILATQLYPSDSNESESRQTILKINNYCWYTTFIFGPIASVIVYGIFFKQALDDTNILRPWTLTYPICEVFTLLSYFAIINVDIRKALHDYHVGDPHWIKIIKETINKVKIHELDP